MRWQIVAVLALEAAGLAGCDAPIDPALADGGAGDTTRLTLGAQLEPGEEATWCQYLMPARDTAGGIALRRIAHTSVGGGGTHHVIWYQMDETPESVAGRLAPFRCDDGVHLRKIGILYAPPAAAGELSWPEDVAAHLAPDAVTLVEWHVINYRPHAVDTAVHLDITRPAATPRLRAGTLLYYDWFVYLPPRTGHTSRTRCRIPADIALVWASQHMHQRGVGFTAQLLDAQGRPLRQLLETERWNADPIWFDEAITLRRGQWIEFACRYDNPSDYGVIEGDKVDDEMCMFVGGYYPQIEVPFGETCSIGDGSGPRFAGEASCADSLACLQAAGDRVAVHACWNATRSEHTDALVELAWRCAGRSCPERCARTGFSDDCMACLVEACASELAVCRAGSAP